MAHLDLWLDRVGFCWPGGRDLFADLSLRCRLDGVVAVCGLNGSGKSTFLELVAGRRSPTSGRIVSTGTISWPVGFAGSFHADLTGAQNTRFLARAYGVDTDALVDFVQAFAGLGQHFHLPVRSYSAGMRSCSGSDCERRPPARMAVMRLARPVRSSVST